jgi:hypothetical protein
MRNKHKAALILLGLLTKEEYSEVCEGMIGNPYICDRPNHAYRQDDYPWGNVERCRVEQHGPGFSGDDFWGNVYVRIQMKWVCIPFSV